MEADLKAALLGAYARLLRPLVRILLRNGVSYPEFTDTVKRVFVQVAATDLGQRGAEANAAQISIRTGVSQREALEVLEGRRGDSIETNLAGITKFLSAWHTEIEYTGPYGLPLELQFEQKTRPDFVSLARTYASGIQPNVLLNQLLSIGAIRQLDDGWLRVLTRTYLPEADVPDSIERIGQAVRYLVETVDFNRQESDQDIRLLERTVSADDGIKEQDVPRFKRYVRGRAQVLLEDIDNWLSQLDKPDPGKGERSVQTGVGIYHYLEEPDD